MFYCPPFIAFTTTPVTKSFTDHAVDATDATTYTFTTRAIGTAASNRQVIVGIEGSNTNTTVSSVTVAGNSGTFIARTHNATQTVELWTTAVTSGTTGTIVVTWGAGQNRCGIGVWAIYSASTSAFATASSTANPMAVSINVPANGAAIGVAGSSNGATYTWTNLTEDYDEAVEGLITHTGASDTFAAAQTPLAVTCTPSASSDNAMVVASWGPA